jgi:hypothetical protein
MASCGGAAADLFMELFFLALLSLLEPNYGFVNP